VLECGRAIAVAEQGDAKLGVGLGIEPVAVPGKDGVEALEPVLVGVCGDDGALALQ